MNTKPLPGIERDTWRKLPLAKQRLAAEGPLETGHGAARDAVLIVAAELRLHGVTENTAAQAVQAIPLADTPGKQRHMRRQFPEFVRWAYNPPDGLPVLTGCPKAPRHSNMTGMSRLRERFAPYCDDACGRTCRIRRACNAPATALIESPFENVWNSTLWVRGAGLGPGGRDVYEVVAALAANSPDHEEPVQAASRWIATRLGHIVGQSNVRDLLKKMDSLGLVTCEDRRQGLYRVRPLTDGQIAQLEAHLGTAEKVAERQRDVEREWLGHREWLNAWDDAEELVGGTGPIAE